MLLCITSENLKKRDYLQDKGLRGRIILKCIPGIGFIWFRMSTMTGCHEHDREPSDSMKYRNIFSLSKKDKFLGRFGCFMCWILKATDTHTEYVILLLYCNSACVSAPEC